MLGAPSFSQPILWIQPTLQSLQRNSSSSVNFHFPISPLLVHKIILTIPTNTPFLYNSVIFHHPFFAYNYPNNPHQKYFTYLKQFSNSGCVKVQRNYGVLWGLTLFNLSLQSIDGDKRTHSQSLILSRSNSKNCCIADVANHQVHLLSYPQQIFITSIFN